MRHRQLLVGFALLACAAPALMAPNPVEPTTPIGPPTWPLPVGLVTTGLLTQDSEVLEDGEFGARYVLDAETGDLIQLWLASHEFDTCLYVFGPDGQQVAWDDDSYEGTNATLSFIAATPGRYQVVATSYSAGALGSYRILAQRGGTYMPPGAGLAAGGVAGELDDKDAIGLETGWPSDYYQLETTALGTLITLTLRSAAFDSVLFVVDSEGRVIARDDNSAGGRDAMLQFPYTPAPGHSFFAVVSTVEGGSHGGYFLQRTDGQGAGPTGNLTPPVDPVGPSNPAAPGTITLGGTITGQLAAGDASGHRPGHVDRYAFRVNELSVVQIDLTGDDLDTYVQLFDGRDLLLAEDDDGGRGTNSRLVEELPIGDYAIEVSTFDGEGSGSYSLAVETAEWLTDPEELMVGAEERARWSVRHPREGQDNRVAYYTLSTRSSRDVTILLSPDSDGIYCRLELFDGGGRSIATSMRIEDGCVLSTNLRGGRDYGLHVVGERHDDDEAYDLYVSERGDTIRWTSIDVNTDVRGHVNHRSSITDWDAPGQGFTFELTDGQRASVSIRNSDIDARAMIIGPRGGTVTSSTDMRRDMSFTAPRDGWYRLVVSGRQRWFGTFTLRVNVGRR